VIRTRIPGEPERYRGRYQATPGAVAWIAPCPACQQDCTWHATPDLALRSDCGCPTDTGTGVVTGKGTAPVPAPTCQETA
jgi:hypothetical protein